MRITAKRIEGWAGQSVAPAELPRLIRRLVHATTTLQAAAMPAGEAVNLPGWDGRTDSDAGSAWVPAGAAYWEWSCEKKVSNKATNDFEKRTSQTAADFRAASAFVFVTARRWPGKDAWAAEHSRRSGWKAVRAYDAETLEEWLEVAPGVGLAFAEELGDVGSGVETPQRFWSTWSGSAAPAITMDACKEGRGELADRLAATLRERAERHMTAPISVRADTAEEAVAFVSGVVQSLPDLALKSLVVTTVNGWRYVEKHETPTIAIAASPELAQRVPQREGLVVVIPYGASDMAAHFWGASGDAETVEIVLDRQIRHDFAKALARLGLNEDDADRLALQVGRSWSIYRRRRAVNPAVRAPRWLTSEAAWVLSVMCLAGGWKSDRAGDRKAVSRIAGQPYEAIEKALITLSRLDDAPVIRIGIVWKAKAPLELLDLFAERITGDELDRYFAEAEIVLSTPDPALELPEENRGAAEIYGKMRAQSGLLIGSLTDALIKLAVRGAEMPGLASLNLRGRVDGLVRDLLRDADSTRWLSLAGLLRPLAEASPKEFLSAVEGSLAKSDKPIAALFSTSGEGDYFSRSYHVDLLWALELLAWSPSRFMRVVRILAQLAKLPLPDRLGNRPSESLLGLFRSWLPQTAAPVEQRIEALKWLVSAEPDVAFKVADKLVQSGSDVGSSGARPHWRSDDAGHGRGASHKDRVAMVVAAADQQIELASDNVERLARMIDKLEDLDKPRVARVLDAVAEVGHAASDEDRERLWRALRKRINWHQQRRERKSEKLPAYHARTLSLYDEIAPKDIVVRHRWLFRDGWPEPPIRRWKPDMLDRTEVIETERMKALKQVLADEGLPGIERLAAAAPGFGFVGQVLSKSGIKLEQVRPWLLQRIIDATPGDQVHDLMFGLLRALPSVDATSLMRDACHALIAAGSNTERVAAVLVSGPVLRPTWELAAELGSDIEEAYWKRCNPNMWVRAGEAEFEFVVRKLCAVGRPAMALFIGHFDIKKIEAGVLLDVLVQFSRDAESDGPKVSSWDICKAIDHLEAAPMIDRHHLALLEFRLFEGLSFEGGRHAKSLYAEITSNPKVFADFICMVYKPSNRTEESEITEQQSHLASHAWHILNDCETMPGTAHDGTFDPMAFKSFVDEARRLCTEADKLGSCDSVLGQILSHAPADADGVWPFGPARDVLDHPDHKRMREGFEVGTHNNRGIVSKSYAEGGGQERNLASRYRRHAAALHNSHPLVASMLESIAESYDVDGKREDDRAKMMMER
jgi:hypothetical protein